MTSKQSKLALENEMLRLLSIKGIVEVFQKQTFIVSIYFLAICTELTSFAEFRPQKVKDRSR